MSGQPQKVFRDNAIQGDYVRLSAPAVSIVDTPIFQRLRFLKQLGMTEYVYPGATHTRFAHSLGVAHRAREFATRLWQKQPELQLSERDLVVLEVAGLCHDLGHGPFSHSFESELVPRLLGPGEKWEHEHMSCLLFNYICAHYQIDLSPDEQQRVKDLILGDRQTAKADWAGREWHFDVVANKRNGLDVDKLDYLKRDNAACGELTTSEFSSLYENMRVIQGEVCFRAAVRSTVQDVYSARAKMHEYVYTHPVAKAVEYMVIDALLLVAEELRIQEALHDPERFALLDDTIVRDIERSTSQTPNMQQAQELLRRLRHRDIYKHVGSAEVPQDKVLDFPKVCAEEILQYQDAAGSGVELREGDVRVHNLKIDYTAGNENPLRHVGMYKDDTDEHAFIPTENPFSPGTFISRQVRLYLTRLCQSAEEKRRYQQAAQTAFLSWQKRQPALRSALVLSPQKSTQTASARKRQGPASQLATTAGSADVGQEEMGGASAAAPAAAGAALALPKALAGAVEEDEGDELVFCSQSRPEAQGGGGGGSGGAAAEPPAKRHLSLPGS